MRDNFSRYMVEVKNIIYMSDILIPCICGNFIHRYDSAYHCLIKNGSMGYLACSLGCLSSRLRKDKEEAKDKARFSVFFILVTQIDDQDLRVKPFLRLEQGMEAINTERENSNYLDEAILYGPMSNREDGLLYRCMGTIKGGRIKSIYLYQIEEAINGHTGTK